MIAPSIMNKKHRKLFWENGAAPRFAIIFKSASILETTARETKN
jgi:hypothetical protein